MYYQLLPGKRMLKQWKLYIPEILFLFLLSLFPLWWMRAGGIVLGHDSAFTLQPEQQLFNHFYAWNNTINTGNDWPYPRGYFSMNMIEVVIFQIFGMEIGQRILFVSWFFLMNLSLFLFLRALFPRIEHRLIRIVGPVFYTINFFLFELWFIADRPKFSFLVILPLTCLILHNLFIKRSNIMRSIVSFFFAFFLFNCAGLPPLIGAYGIIVSVLLIIFSIREIIIFRAKGLKRVIFVFIGFIITGVISQAYWLLPFYSFLKTGYSSSVSAVGGIEGAIAWEKMVSSNASILNIIRIAGSPNWIGEYAYSYANYYSHTLLYTIGLIPFFIIVINFLYMLFARKKIDEPTWLFVLFIIFFLGIFLASGTHRPTGILFELMMRKLPGFAIFRSSYYKFMPVVIFSMSILFSYSLYRLVGKIKLLQKNALMIISLIVISLLFYNFPFLTKNPFQFTWGFSTLINVPSYSKEIADLVHSSEKIKRILLLPEIDTGYINVPTDTYSWNYYSLEPFPWLLLNKPILSNSAGAPLIIQSLISSLRSNQEEYIAQLNNVLGISHVLFRKDISIKDNLLKEEQIALWSDLLDSSSMLTKVIEKGEWVLYEFNSQSKPLLFKSLSQANAPIDSLLHLLSMQDSNGAIIFDSVNTSESLSKDIDTQIWKASCLFCKENEFENLVKSINIESYHTGGMENHQITSSKERKQYNNPSLDSGARIDMNLAFSNRALLIIPNQTKIIDEYIKYIEDIFLHLEKLSQERQLEYISRTLAFLIAQQRYIESQPNQYTEIISYVNQSVTNLKKRVVLSEPERNIYRYLVTLPKGDYTGEIILKDTDKIFWKILIDGNDADDSQLSSLNEGFHKIELVPIKKITQHHIPSVYIKRVINQITDPVEEVEQYVQISPVEIQITIPPSPNTRILALPITFHSGWKLIKNDSLQTNNSNNLFNFRTLQTYLKNERNVQHINLFGFSNGWIIPKVNEPTIYTLFFYPQVYVVSGFFVTIFSFLICSIYVIISLKNFNK